MSNQESQTRDWKPYLAGAFLLYIGCFIWGMPPFSTALDQKLIWGITLGTLVWVPAAPVHLLVQFLGRRLLRAVWESNPRRDVIVLNIPVIFFVLSVLALALFRTDRGPDLFKRNVLDPVPTSVLVTDYGILAGIGETSVALEFEIHQSDLTNILRLGSFKLRDQQEQENELREYTRAIKEETGLGVKLQPPYFHYYVASNGIRKHIFSSTNQPRAYFWLHRGPDPILE